MGKARWVCRTGKNTASWRRLGEIFVERGFVSQGELDQALTRQRQTGERLGEALVAQGVISKFELTGALAEQMAALGESDKESDGSVEPGTVHQLPARDESDAAAAIPPGNVVEFVPPKDAVVEQAPDTAAWLREMEGTTVESGADETVESDLPEAEPAQVDAFEAPQAETAEPDALAVPEAEVSELEAVEMSPAELPAAANVFEGSEAGVFEVGAVEALQAEAAEPVAFEVRRRRSSRWGPSRRLQAEAQAEAAEPVAFEGSEAEVFEVGAVEALQAEAQAEAAEPVAFEGSEAEVFEVGAVEALETEAAEPVAFEGSEAEVFEVGAVEALETEAAEPVAFEGSEAEVFEVGAVEALETEAAEPVAFEGSEAKVSEAGAVQMPREEQFPVEPSPVGEPVESRRRPRASARRGARDRPARRHFRGRSLRRRARRPGCAARVLHRLRAHHGRLSPDRARGASGAGRDDRRSGDRRACRPARRQVADPRRRAAVRVCRGDGDGSRRARRPLAARHFLARPALHSGRGPLAQLVEQGTFNPKVAGSIPARPMRDSGWVRRRTAPDRSAGGNSRFVRGPQDLTSTFCMGI